MSIKPKVAKPKDTTSWNPFVGCNFDCVYCEPSFKRLARLYGPKRKCTSCVAYAPHNHLEMLYRLSSDIVYRVERVISVVLTGDISFCDPAFVDQIINVMKNDKKEGRVFLMQSKDPAWFTNILHKLPENVVLMTTIETNRDSGYSRVSKAPLPSKRFQDFLGLAWPRKAMVMEPILQFDLNVILQWATLLKPEAFFIGLVTKGRKLNLQQPTPADVQNLHNGLQNLGLNHYDKKIKKYRDVF